MVVSTSRPLSRGIALVLLVVMGVMWGLQFAMLKITATGGHSELSVLMAALILLSLAFLAIVVARRETFPPDWSIVRFFVIISILGYVVPLLATLYAAPHLSAGVLVLLASLAPVAAIVTALALRSEHVTLTRIGTVALALVSVLMVIAPELRLPDLGATHWLLVALLVPLTYGVESVYVAYRWPKRLNALQAVTGETIVAALLVAPVFAIHGGTLPLMTSWGEAELAILGFVAAGIVESLLYFYLIQKTGGVFVNFGTFIALFAGIAWGMLLFGESHPVHVWLAVGILVAALALASRERHGG